MYVVYSNLLYFCQYFCLLTIKIYFPQKIYPNVFYINKTNAFYNVLKMCVTR